MTRVARSWDRTRFINAWYAHNNADYTVLIDVAYPSSYVSRCFNLFDFSSIKSTTKYDIINFSFSMNSFSIISRRFYEDGKNNLNILYYKYFLLIIYIFIITFFFWFISLFNLYERIHLETRFCYTIVTWYAKIWFIRFNCVSCVKNERKIGKQRKEIDLSRGFGFCNKNVIFPDLFGFIPRIQS